MPGPEVTKAPQDPAPLESRAPKVPDSGSFNDGFQAHRALKTLVDAEQLLRAALRDPAAAPKKILELPQAAADPGSNSAPGQDDPFRTDPAVGEPLANDVVRFPVGPIRVELSARDSALIEVKRLLATLEDTELARSEPKLQAVLADGYTHRNPEVELLADLRGARYALRLRLGRMLGDDAGTPENETATQRPTEAAGDDIRGSNLGLLRSVCREYAAAFHDLPNLAAAYHRHIDTDPSASDVELRINLQKWVDRELEKAREHREAMTDAWKAELRPELSDAVRGVASGENLQAFDQTLDWLVAPDSKPEPLCHYAFRSVWGKYHGQSAPAGEPGPAAEHAWAGLKAQLLPVYKHEAMLRSAEALLDPMHERTQYAVRAGLEELSARAQSDLDKRLGGESPQSIALAYYLPGLLTTEPLANVTEFGFVERYFPHAVRTIEEVASPEPLDRTAPYVRTEPGQPLASLESATVLAVPPVAPTELSANPLAAPRAAIRERRMSFQEPEISSGLVLPRAVSAVAPLQTRDERNPMGPVFAYYCAAQELKRLRSDLSEVSAADRETMRNEGIDEGAVAARKFTSLPSAVYQLELSVLGHTQSERVPQQSIPNWIADRDLAQTLEGLMNELYRSSDGTAEAKDKSLKSLDEAITAVETQLSAWRKREGDSAKLLADQWDTGGDTALTVPASYERLRKPFGEFLRAR